MINESKAYKYCRWCVEPGNRKAPLYVKLQAQSWLDIADGKDNEAYVDQKAYNKICKILKLMVHPDLNCSMYDGLEDYQWFLLTAVFCTRQAETDNRYYITALLEISRKNFKTFSAGLFLLLEC